MYLWQHRSPGRIFPQQSRDFLSDKLVHLREKLNSHPTDLRCCIPAKWAFHVRSESRTHTRILIHQPSVGIRTRMGLCLAFYRHLASWPPRKWQRELPQRAQPLLSKKVRKTWHWPAHGKKRSFRATPEYGHLMHLRDRGRQFAFGEMAGLVVKAGHRLSTLHQDQAAAHRHQRMTP